QRIGAVASVEQWAGSTRPDKSCVPAWRVAWKTAASLVASRVVARAQHMGAVLEQPRPDQLRLDPPKLEEPKPVSVDDYLANRQPIPHLFDLGPHADAAAF